ncbi:MAG: hypothetical protein IKX36_07580 [Prevotella sp.]|nr:hypothetical protein [Prevotella sp.]
MEQELLKKEVGRKAGFTPETSHDFEDLSQLIQAATGEYLSPTTLKRIWGYLQNEQVQTRRHTYDVLARYAGYASYRGFTNEATKKQGVQSMILTENKVTAKDLFVGQQLCITWLPDRRIVVEHLGDGRFVVNEAENAKLTIGDTFTCHLMLQNEPLYLDEVSHHGTVYPAYIAGKIDGVKIYTLN